MKDYFPEELQQEYLQIIKKAFEDKTPPALNSREFTMFIYYQRNYRKREFSFVPRKYRKGWYDKNNG